MKNFIPVLGRIFIAVIFVMAGVGKVLHPAETQGYMASHNMPFVALFMWSAAALEILGGLSLILGFWTKIGAAALFLFLIPTTLIFHTNFADSLQTIMFTKNLSIMGGLLMVTYFGAGPLSFDNWLKNT